jgi:hypothetical protein
MNFHAYLNNYCTFSIKANVLSKVSNFTKKKEFEFYK